MPITETPSTCPYCGVGCGVLIATQDEQIVGVRGDPQHPANLGRLCTKGSTLHLTASPQLQQQLRLLTPARRLRRDLEPQALGWDEALDEAAERFAQIIAEHGPSSVGFYISGQMLTEDYYVFNKLAKGLLGTNNVDTNSRLCMSSAVTGYKASLGADAPPACYEDMELADTLFIVGSNMAYAHPILFRRIEDARARRGSGMRLIVVDPRRTQTAEVADLHLPILPGTDVALFHGMLHIMLAAGWVDESFIAAHTQGFEALRERVQDFAPATVAQLCGIALDDLVKASMWFAGLHSAEPSSAGGRASTLSLYCQGLNQSRAGTDKNTALINLHLATGQIGKPGCGPFSLTGQPNAMGGREVGGMATLASAHRSLSNPQDRQEIADLWGVKNVPGAPGKTAVEMFEAAAKGEIKALWIACTNPAQSMPDQRMVRQGLLRASYVVVQEAYANTATTAFADLLLPATTWGEKDGTVTNSERCISRVRAAIAAPGQARADWAIACDFATRLQSALARLAPNWLHERVPPQARLFDYPDAQAIWEEHRASTAGRDLDITGMSYALLDSLGPQQWPMPAGSRQGQARLYTDGHFPTQDGRARFTCPSYVPPAEERDVRYPYALTTGRLRDQWHGMSRTGSLGRLFGHAPEPVVELNAQDMARVGLDEGDLVQVTSRRGSIILPAQVSASVAPTQAFIAMHWGQEVLSGRSASGQILAGVNALTNSAACPQSRQPELKYTAVKLLKAELPWRLTAISWLPAEEALLVRERMREFMGDFAFASCVPFGREPSERGVCGVLFRGARHEALSPARIEQMERLLGLGGPQVSRYHDRKRQQHRALLLEPRGTARHLRAILLAGDVRAQSWLRTLLQDDLPVDAYARALFLPSERAPVDIQESGPQVCTCLNVPQTKIVDFLRQQPGQADEDSQLAALKDQLKCGTNCGSCIPELRRLIRQTSLQATA